MPSGYSSREDPGQIKKNKQSMADLKLRRLTELNTRLREDLERERIPVSQAAKRYMLPSGSSRRSHRLTIGKHHRLHQQHERLHGSVRLGNR